MKNQKLSLPMKIVAVLLLLIGFFTVNKFFLYAMTLNCVSPELFDVEFGVRLVSTMALFSGVFILLRIKWAWYLAVLSIIPMILWALYTFIDFWGFVGYSILSMVFVLFFSGMLWVLFWEKKKYFSLKTSWTKKRFILSTLVMILLLFWYGLPVLSHLFLYYDYYNNGNDCESRIDVLIPTNL